MIHRITDLPKASIVRYILSFSKVQDTSYIYQAIKANQDLTYNTKTGKLKKGKQVMAEYSYRKDIPQYDHIMDTICEFAGYIANEAKLLQTKG